MAKQAEWDRFLADAEIFLDNYNELVGILSQFEKNGKLKGKVNKAIEELNKKINGFLKIYDQDGNKEIDIEELTTKREELIADLNKGDKSEVRGMVRDIKNLETAIIEYRKISFYEETMIKKDEAVEQKVKKTTDLDDHFKEKDQQLETKIEVNPK